MIHNQTATNIPFSLDHFSQLLISREEGLVISVNTSIDKSDEPMAGFGIILQVDPSEMKALVGVNVDTPFLEVSGQISTKKPQNRPLEIKLITKTDSEQSELLNHEMQVCLMYTRCAVNYFSLVLFHW